MFDQLLSPPLLYLPCVSAGPPPDPEVPAVEEPEDDDVVVMSMSMDEGDDGETPRKSRAQKRAIVTSPSEKDEHPSRRLKYEVSVQSSFSLSSI